VKLGSNWISPATRSETEHFGKVPPFLTNWTPFGHPTNADTGRWRNFQACFTITSK